MVAAGRAGRDLEIAACNVHGPLKQVKARINVDNLFDKDYRGAITTTTSTPATFRPGPRRTVQVTLSTDF